MGEEAKDILVAAPDRWDEACFAVPAVRALIASGLGTGVVCRDGQRDFWETVVGLEVLAFPASAKPKAAAAVIRGNWKASLAWEGGFGSEAARLAGVERRLGPDEKPLARGLTHPLEVSTGPLEHRVRHYLATVEALGVESLAPEFFAPAALGVEMQPGTVLLCPDSDHGPAFEWPVERWAGVAAGLRERGLRVTVAGLAGGRGLAGRLASELEGVECFTASPPAGALPLFAVHQVVVAADGSLPHLAAFAGATCVTLFGPNDAAWKRPLGRRHVVVRRPVECAPCLLAKCPLDHRCQNELETGMVLAAVEGVLA